MRHLLQGLARLILYWSALNVSIFLLLTLMQMFLPSSGDWLSAARAASPVDRVMSVAGSSSDVPDPPDVASRRLAYLAARERAAARRSWSAIGLDGGGVEGLVGNDGTFAPANPGPGFNVWLRDNKTGVVFRPTRTSVTQSLVDGHLPLIQTDWSVDGAAVSWTVFAASSGIDPIGRQPGDVPLELVRLSVTARTGGGSWSLYLVAQPDDPTQASYPIRWVAATPTTLAINDKLMLVASRPADFVGAIDQARVNPLVLDPRDLRDDPTASVSDHELGLGFLGYTMRLAAGQTETYGFDLPLGDAILTPDQLAQLGDQDVTEAERQVAQAWHARLHQIDLSLPDQQLTDAFYASVSQMLMARADNSLFSGPTAEHAVWVRDSAYITAALTRSGQARVVEPVLRLFTSAQLPSGREPPIIEASGAIRQPMKTEWDAQGEFVHALVDYARQTRDDAFLRDVYPFIRTAVAFQQDQLASTSQPDLVGTPYYGIVPAGESAEDLYDATWHHYWDDFWALTGVRDAADAAKRLGYADDARQYETAEAVLRANVLASIAHTNPPNGPDTIWNGPEDRHTTAMARSATPSVWPEEVLDPHMLVVRQSFEQYYRWTVAPYGGAYMHYGNNYWPYAGVGLAHAFYRLGMDREAWQMLDWVMRHQTAPNLYAWGEVVDPQRFDMVIGDLPHSWMAAELVLFVRDVVLREDADVLEIGPYPPAWLAPGATVSIHHAPTRFGDEGYVLTRSADGRTIHVQLEGVPPAGGYLVTLPAELSFDLTATGWALLAPADAQRAFIPASVRDATFALAPA